MALIYGEIDITVPNIPLEHFIEFVNSTKNSHVSYGHSIEEEIYFSRNKRKYPWNRRILEHNENTYHEYNNHKCFEPLVDIMDKLPVKKGKRVILLLHQQQQLEYDFNFHFDKDKPYGFRICLGLDTNKSFLEQSKLKDEYLQHALDLKKIENYMVHDKIYTIKPKKSNTVFCLNGDRFPHRVPVDSNSQRVSIIVRGELENLESLTYLQKEEE